MHDDAPASTPSPAPAARPGSAGEHRIQEQLGSTHRADRFYAEQMLDHLNGRMQEFIARQEMFFLATADAHGECDNTFRAGPPGFLRVLDARTLVFPEYRGNGVHASLGNIRENPHLGILLIDFLRARVGLHVNGRAQIVPDAELRAQHPDLPVDPVPGRRAELWVRVTVEEAYIHCAKHIPHLQRAPRGTARDWGTDDHRRKAGDYFASAPGDPAPGDGPARTTPAAPASPVRASSPSSEATDVPGDPGRTPPPVSAPPAPASAPPVPGHAAGRPGDRDQATLALALPAPPEPAAAGPGSGPEPAAVRAPLVPPVPAAPPAAGEVPAPPRAAPAPPSYAPPPPPPAVPPRPVGAPPVPPRPAAAPTPAAPPEPVPATAELAALRKAALAAAPEAVPAVAPKAVPAAAPDTPPAPTPSAVPDRSGPDSPEPHSPEPDATPGSPALAPAAPGPPERARAWQEVARRVLEEAVARERADGADFEGWFDPTPAGRATGR